MATNICSPGTLAPSLTSQIGEAERRLQKRRRLVRVRGATLNRKLRQWVTDPGVLLWGGGIGFLIGELTQRHTAEPQGPRPSTDAGHPFFDPVRNLISLASLARPLFSALPGAREPFPTASDASARTPEPRHSPEEVQSTPVHHPISRPGCVQTAVPFTRANCINYFIPNSDATRSMMRSKTSSLIWLPNTCADSVFHICADHFNLGRRGPLLESVGDLTAETYCYIRAHRRCGRRIIWLHKFDHPGVSLSHMPGLSERHHRGP